LVSVTVCFSRSVLSSKTGDLANFAYRKANEKTIIDNVSAAPVRQSDHGANVNSDTATTLIAIVAVTTCKRSRSSVESALTCEITTPI
jgi:hypothetical protein